MMRDKINNKPYFDEFIRTKNQLIVFNNNSLLEGKIDSGKIDSAKFRNLNFQIESLIAQYSMGDTFYNLSNSVDTIINNLHENWYQSETKIKNNKGDLSNQYMVSPYERFLHVLSIAYLLETSDRNFKILTNILDRDKISDNIYEFIITARFPNREQNRPEEYDPEHSVILKVYDKLRRATQQTNKAEASKLVKQFLEKDFYHKHMNLYNSHNSKANIYCGYWSFESAAVVKIMGLDDSSFIDNQYYPKDLVHQNPEPPNKKGFLGKLGF